MMSTDQCVTDSLMPETDAAKKARLRQRKTELETARRAVQKRLKELDPAFIEKKRLNLEMKEQKAAVQAGKKRDRLFNSKTARKWHIDCMGSHDSPALRKKGVKVVYLKQSKAGRILFKKTEITSFHPTDVF